MIFFTKNFEIDDHFVDRSALIQVAPWRGHGLSAGGETENSGYVRSVGGEGPNSVDASKLHFEKQRALDFLKQ